MGTPIQKLGETSGNTLFMKREDLIPFSFGGNKARKAEYFFKEIDEGGYDCVVTYGSSSSNHCRVVANLAAARGLPRCCSQKSVIIKKHLLPPSYARQEVLFPPVGGSEISPPDPRPI